MRIKVLTIDHYDEIISLWRRIEGLGLSAADEKPAIEAFLRRNPRMSFIASENGIIVGTVLCGHDGRRGYLYHLAVDPDHRIQGIGELLVRRALEKLRQEGIGKSHIFIFQTNYAGKQFWRRVGWNEREDILVFSREMT